MSQPNSKRITYFRPETESSSLVFTNSCALPTTVIVADVQRNLLNRPALAERRVTAFPTRENGSGMMCCTLFLGYFCVPIAVPLFPSASLHHITIFRPGRTLIPKVLRTIITVAIFWTAMARPVAMAPPTTPYVGISRAHAISTIAAPR